MEDYKKLYEELKKKEKIDFSKQMEFISALQKEPSPEKNKLLFPSAKRQKQYGLVPCLASLF